MAADDDDVVVLRATGETLPNGPLDAGGNGVVYLLATPAQAASGESLLSFLKNPEEGYVLKEIKGKRYAWKPLTPDLQVVPRVAHDIHVFLIKAPPATTGGASGSEWTDDQRRVDHLVAKFGQRLREARQIDRATLRTEDGELPESIADPGAYFVIRGRRKTMKSLIRAGASIYRAFRNTEGEDQYKRGVFLHMAVAYPGAGKSTIGNDFPRILRDIWESDMPWVDSILDDAFKGAEEGEQAEYKAMVQVSLGLGFELCMYHNLVVTNCGGLLPKEAGLEAAQVLALRALHGALCTPRSDYQYTELLGELPEGVKVALTLQDVVSFIREVLLPKDDRLILLSWFFDELNAAACTRTGQVVTVGIATWAQDMLSEFVSWMYNNRSGNTFIVVGGATTRFSASSLCYTKSGRAKAHFVELRPLTPDEATEVIEVFCSRLFNKPREPCPGWMQLLLDMSGGVPRMIQLLIRAVVTVDAKGKMSRSVLQNCLSMETMTKGDLEEVIGNWIGLCGSADFFTDYTSPLKLPLLMAALRTSLLGTEVTRRTRVLPLTFEDMNDEYGHLEGQGVVALCSTVGGIVGDEDVDKRAYSTFGERLERVRFPPVLFFYLMRKNSTQPGLLQAFSSSWKVKEVADLFIIRLNVWLYWLTLAPQPPDRWAFTLQEIMPLEWSIPPMLARKKFKLVGDIEKHKRIGKLKSFAFLKKCLLKNPGCAFFSGSGNSGSDSLCLLEEVATGLATYMFVESKLITDALKRTPVDFVKIRAKAVKGLKLLVNFKQNEVDEEAVTLEHVDVDVLERKKQKLEIWYDDAWLMEELGIELSEDDESDGEDDEDYNDESDGEDDEDKDAGEGDAGDKWLSLSQTIWVYMTDQSVLEEVRKVHQKRVVSKKNDDLVKSMIIGATYPRGSSWDCAGRLRRCVSVLRVNL